MRAQAINVEVSLGAHGTSHGWSKRVQALCAAAAIEQQGYLSLKPIEVSRVLGSFGQIW